MTAVFLPAIAAMIALLLGANLWWRQASRHRRYGNWLRFTINFVKPQPVTGG